MLLVVFRTFPLEFLQVKAIEGRQRGAMKENNQRQPDGGMRCGMNCSSEAKCTDLCLLPASSVSMAETAVGQFPRLRRLEIGISAARSLPLPEQVVVFVRPSCPFPTAWCVD